MCGTPSIKLEMYGAPPAKPNECWVLINSQIVTRSILCCFDCIARIAVKIVRFSGMEKSADTRPETVSSVLSSKRIPPSTARSASMFWGSGGALSFWRAIDSNPARRCEKWNFHGCRFYVSRCGRGRRESADPQNQHAGRAQRIWFYRKKGVYVKFLPDGILWICGKSKRPAMVEPPMAGRA